MECKCKKVVIATRGGGLRPHRHDGTSPLPAYTTLALAFSPNVSKNEKEGPGGGRMIFCKGNRPLTRLAKKTRKIATQQSVDCESLTPTRGATQKSVDCESLTPTRGATQQSVDCESLTPTRGATQKSVDCESLTPTRGATQKSVDCESLTPTRGATQKSVDCESLTPTRGATQKSVDCESLTPTRGATQQSVDSGIVPVSSIAPEGWGPKEGGNATSPLHSRGSPTKGTKSEVKTYARGHHDAPSISRYGSLKQPDAQIAALR